MDGKIYRVTYNFIKQIAEVHMRSGEVINIPMTNAEWDDNLRGNLIENFNRLLDE